MMAKPREQNEVENSGQSGSEKSAEYVKFENAAKIVFRYDPKRVRKKPTKKRKGS